jgi:hypothetical protein
VIERFPWPAALAAGLVINVSDVAWTLLFAVKPWEAELKRQGIAPSKWTPPYYLFANFVGGLAMSLVYLALARATAPGPAAAFAASVLVWLVSRVYGGGHVVMGQMPFSIFAVMSAGLGLGYVAAGQVFRLLVGG